MSKDMCFVVPHKKYIINIDEKSDDFFIDNLVVCPWVCFATTESHLQETFV
jgi:hypothetical protein